MLSPSVLYLCDFKGHTCNCEVEETLFVVSTRLLRFLQLGVRHVSKHVLQEQRFELGVSERRVPLARRVVEDRVNLLNPPCKQLLSWYMNTYSRSGFSNNSSDSTKLSEPS